MKSIGALIGLGIATFLTFHAGTTPTTVHAADRAISKTETALKDATTKSRANATEITTTITTPDRAASLPTELQEFVRSTEHLATLRATLCHDIEMYQAAAVAKLAEFDQEHAAITDPATQRGMQRVRRQIEQDLTARFANARATLAQLETVLRMGSDLQHAATCILIADSVHQHGDELDRQIAQARTTASQYATTTNSLLARINTATAD